jgi:uncharacterized Zn-binding protein involved in type VI secretion
MSIIGFIVVGDRTSHGGEVITGDPTWTVDGIPVARVGDKVSCPRCERVATIVSSRFPTLTDNGSPLAYDQDRTDCGAVLYSRHNGHAGWDDGNDQGDAVVSTLAAATPAASAAPAVLVASADPSVAFATLAASSDASPQFDEQIQFVDEKGQPLAGAEYVLYQDQTQLVSGVTDQDGKTARVVTQQQTKITSVDLTMEFIANCHLGGPNGPPCPLPYKENIKIALEGVSTNPVDVGQSVVQHKIESFRERPLTSGEIAMARQVFGNSIDYSKVKVHNHGYLWFNLQGKNTAMSPDGEIYFREENYEADFSNPSTVGKSAYNRIYHWFIHEMGHVWQYQLGYGVKKKGAVLQTTQGKKAYYYQLDPNKNLSLSDYNMEQQCEIIADYYSMKFLREANAYEYATHNITDLHLYEDVLSNFLTNPSDTANLPK